MILRTLALSWGLDSFTIAAMIALGELPPIDFAIFADIGYEYDHTYRFKDKWESWLNDHGVKTVTIQVDIIKKNTDIGTIPAFTKNTESIHKGYGKLKHQCSEKWKARNNNRYIRNYYKEMGIPRSEWDVRQYVGYSLEEARRLKPNPIGYITSCVPVEYLDLRSDKEKGQLELFKKKPK